MRNLLLSLILLVTVAQSGCTWKKLNVFDGAFSKFSSHDDEKSKTNKGRSDLYQGGFEF